MKFRFDNAFPILKWLPGYKRSYLQGDLFAGLTVGVMLIPQGMAYAMIAGLPPVYGLYASLVPQVVYALLGTSRMLAVGAVAMDSLLLAAGVSVLAQEGTDTYITYAVLVAFIVGVFQFLLGVLKLGFITNLLSRPVISGFTSAAAVLIGLNQLKYLFGYSIDRSTQITDILLSTVRNLDKFHRLTFIIGLVGILILVVSKKINKNIPGALVVVVLGTLSAYLFGLNEMGVAIVRDIPKGLPGFELPRLQVDMVLDVLPLSVTIGIVAYMEAFSVAKAMESPENGDKVLPNQELIALGAANFIGSLFQSYSVTAGFSRTAVNGQVGARTQLASIVAAFLVALTLLFFTPLFYYLPEAILASIIMVAVINLVDIPYAKRLWKTSRMECLILIATFLTTINFGMVTGIVGGVGFSVLLMIYRIAYPHMAILGRLRGHYEFRNVRRFADLETWESILIVRMDGPLLYVNVQYFKDYLERQVLASRDVKHVIIDAAAISHIDATAMAGIQELKYGLGQQGITLYFTDLVGPVRDMLRRGGLIEDIRSQVFLDLNEAVDFIVKAKPPQYSKEAVQTRIGH